MSRVKRLQPVLEMAVTAEETAAKAFESARQYFEADQQKLLELRQYYDDYELSFCQPQPFVRIEQMQRQRGFLHQLREACEQQEATVQQRQKALDHKQLNWQECHLKRKALQDFVDRLKVDELKELNKKEEKMLDEWFLQTAHQRSEKTLY